MAEAEYIYFVSSYERGDSFSEVVFMESSLKAAVHAIEEERDNWVDGIYTHAIIWRVAIGDVINGVTEIVGVYAIRKGMWIDFHIEESKRKNGRIRRALAFSKYEIIIGDGHKSGPNLTFNYRKNQMVATTPVDLDGKKHALHLSDDSEARDISKMDFFHSLAKTDG